MVKRFVDNRWNSRYERIGELITRLAPGDEECQRQLTILKNAKTILEPVSNLLNSAQSNNFNLRNIFTPNL